MVVRRRLPGTFEHRGAMRKRAGIRLGVNAVSLLCLLLLSTTDAAWADALERYERSADFESGAAPAWTCRTPRAWGVVDDGTRFVYQLHVPVFDRTEYALVADRPVIDLTLGLLTKPLVLTEGGSLDILFAYQDAENYAAFRIQPASPTVLRLTRVTGGTETALASQTVPDRLLRPGRYHRVKLEQDSHLRRVAAYIDDMHEPVLTGTELDLPPGQVAIGATAMAANYDDLVLIGSVAPAAATQTVMPRNDPGARR